MKMPSTKLCQKSPVWKSKFYGAFVLNLRVDLHAIDATPARWRGDAGSSPLDRAKTAASSPRNDLVNPTHWLISTQEVAEEDVEAERVVRRRLLRLGARRAAGPSRSPRPVWKSTSATGAPDNSSLSHFSAMTRPCWLERAAIDHNATPSSWRRVDGVEVMIQPWRRRAATI